MLSIATSFIRILNWADDSVLDPKPFAEIATIIIFVGYLTYQAFIMYLLYGLWQYV